MRDPLFHRRCVHLYPGTFERACLRMLRSGAEFRRRIFRLQPVSVERLSTSGWHNKSEFLFFCFALMAIKDNSISTFILVIRIFECLGRLV